MEVPNYQELQIQSKVNITTCAVSHLDLIKNINFLQKLKEWVEYWQFHVFSVMEKQIIELGDLHHIYYLQYFGGKIIGLLHFMLKNFASLNMYRPYLKIDYILDPVELKKNYKIISHWMKSRSYIDLIVDVCQNFHIKMQMIPFVFMEFPENSLIEIFISYFKNDEGMNDWVINVYPLDERIFEGTIEKFRNTYHIFWNHSNFDPTPPKKLVCQYQMALKLQQYMINRENVFTGLAFSEFANVITTWEKYQLYQDDIKKKMSIYFIERNKIWEKFDQFHVPNRESIAQNYIQLLEENIRLLYNFRFRARYFDMNSPTADEIIRNYRYDILMNYIQAINSQGSMFSDFINSDCRLNHEVFSLLYIKTSFGAFGGILEFEIAPNQWILAGIAQGQYRKDPKYYSKQFINALIMQSLFRGYNLAGLLAIIGILTASEKYDIIFDDATVYNKRTHRLVKRMGFETYGLIFNPLIVPNPEDPTLLTSASILRNFWIHWKHQASNSPVFSVYQKLLKEQILTPFYQ